MQWLKHQAKRFISDKDGKVAVWQTPNLPLAVWAAATIAAKFFDNGASHKLFAGLAFGAIFIWACLELAKGVSPFRRVLGLLVLVATTYSRIN